MTDEWEAKLESLRKRKPAEEFVTIPDQDAHEALDRARMELAKVRHDLLVQFLTDGVDDPTEAQFNRNAAYKRASKAVAEAEKVVDDTDVVFHFRAIDADVYEHLKFEHPPTDEQREKSGYDANMDTYIPALISACSVKPLSVETLNRLKTPDDDGNVALSQGDIAVMYATCRKVNEIPRVSLGKGSRPTPG